MSHEIETIRRNRNAQFCLVEELVDLRIARNYDPVKLAEYLGVTPRTLELIESGEYEMNQTELRQYASWIGAVIEYKIEEL